MIDHINQTSYMKSLSKIKVKRKSKGNPIMDIVNEGTRSQNICNRNRIKRYCYRTSEKIYSDKTPPTLALKTSPEKFYWKKKRQFYIKKVFIFLIILLQCLGTSSSSYCPKRCSCNDISVDCANAELEFVPTMLNPTTMTITLSNNKIKTVEDSLMFYYDLTDLDLSRNELTDLGLKHFKSNEVLKTLSLDENKLNALQVDNFYGLSTLELLSLNSNLLTFIDNKVFKGLDSLQNLYLERNRIRDVSNFGFEGLSNIRTISLMSNKLQNVPTAAISRLSSLQELNLGDNKISIVPERAFQTLTNLSYLNLSRNNISLIHPNAFMGLDKLRILNLRDNRINIVPNAAFPPLSSLNNLDLSGNLFATIPRDLLGHLSSLQHLKIERCPRLEVISHDSFVSGWALQDLSFSQNPRLRILPPAALAPLLALKTLDISSCGLETLQPTQVPMSNLKMLDISGNPLLCNCSLMWLVQVASNHTFAPGRPSCAAPPALYGVPIKDLGAGTCSSSVGVWTIAGCVGVALSGILTILAFLICRWKRRRNPPPSSTATKPFQVCSDGQSSIQRHGEFTHLNNDLPHTQQIYSSPSYYTATAPPNQFMYTTQPRPLHSCPPDCACIRQSPALRPLLRSTASTPTQSHILNNSLNQNVQPPNFVDFPPPPPTRPPPTVSISHLHRNNHYHYSPQFLALNSQHLHQQQSHGNINPLTSPVYGSAGGSPAHKQLLSADWLYGPPANSDDNPHHWYASIDGSNSSQSAGQGNESSGYWEEDKELPTSSLLPNKVTSLKDKKENKNVNSKESPPLTHGPEKKIISNPPGVVKDTVPTSYI